MPINPILIDLFAFIVLLAAAGVVFLGFYLFMRLYRAAAVDQARRGKPMGHDDDTVAYSARAARAPSPSLSTPSRMEDRKRAIGPVFIHAEPRLSATFFAAPFG